MRKIDLTGYRTVISLVISLVLKLLVAKGLLSAEKNDTTTLNAVTDGVILVLSGIFDLSAVYFKVKSPAPGIMTPEGKAYRKMVVSGGSRPKFDPAIEAAIKALEKAKEPPGYDGTSQCPIRDVYCPIADAYQRGELVDKPGVPKSGNTDPK